MPWQLYPQERDLVPLLQEVGWASGPAYNGCRKSCPPLGFDSWAFHSIASPDTDSKKIRFLGSLHSVPDKNILPGFKQCVCKIFIKKYSFCYLINFFMSSLMLNCWLSKCFNYLVAIIMCWCLQTNSQVTLTVHLRRICVAGLKSKWHGRDRMVHMPIVLVRTTHTRMHQVSFYNVSWTYLVLSSTNWKILWVWLRTVDHLLL